jgi:hypothetical protein
LGLLVGAFREVAISIAEVVNILREQNPSLTEFDPEENGSLKLITEFDPDGNEDLKRIIELETEAEAVRELLSPLLNDTEA